MELSTIGRILRGKGITGSERIIEALLSKAWRKLASEIHDDVPDNVREQLYVEERQRLLK